MWMKCIGKILRLWMKNVIFVGNAHQHITTMGNINENKLLAVGAVVRSPREKYEVTGVIKVTESGVIYEVRAVDAGVGLIMKECDAADPDLVASVDRIFRQLASEDVSAVKVTEAFIDGAKGYMVMERFDGTTLRELVDTGGPLSQRRMLELMRGVVKAAGALHASGMTHFGISPDNILVDGDGDAMLAGVSLSGSARRPAAGFSAIEQYAGAPRFSPVTDVYSLAATMLFCLTGKTIPAAAEVTDAILDEMLGADTVAPLRDLLKRSLSFRIAERPASAGGMLAAFDEIEARLQPDVAPQPEIAAISSMADDVSEDTVVSEPAMTEDESTVPEDDEDVYVPQALSITHKAEALASGQTKGAPGSAAGKPYQSDTASASPVYKPVSFAPAGTPPVPPESSGYGNGGSSIGGESRKSRKKMWWTIALVLLAAAVGGGVYWFMTRPYEVSFDDVDEDETVTEAESISEAEVAEVVEAEELPRGYYDMVFNELVPGSGVRQMEWNGITFTFDRDGRWTNDNYYDALLGYHTWEFDGNRRTKENYTGSDKYESGYAMHVWNSDNRVYEMFDNTRGYTLMRTFNPDGTIASQTVDFSDESKKDGYASFSYTYDSRGNWVTRTGGPGKVTRRIEYYD